jgi:5-methylcytosine-specific restriction endonuclease McrA
MGRKDQRQSAPQIRPVSRSRRVLAVVAADNTFHQTMVQGTLHWVGKCIHCNAKVLVTLQGETGATLEHIEPKTHGGSDAVENLALACARCNSGKGMRLDHRKRSDPTLSKVIETLQARRLERLRNPP